MLNITSKGFSTQLKHSDLITTSKVGALNPRLTPLPFSNIVMKTVWSLLLMFREITLFKQRLHQSCFFTLKHYKCFSKESNLWQSQFDPPIKGNLDIILVMRLKKDSVGSHSSPMVQLSLERVFGNQLLLKAGLTYEKLRTKSISYCGRLRPESMTAASSGQLPTTLCGRQSGPRVCPMPGIYLT